MLSCISKSDVDPWQLLLLYQIRYMLLCLMWIASKSPDIRLCTKIILGLSLKSFCAKSGGRLYDAQRFEHRHSDMLLCDLAAQNGPKRGLVVLFPHSFPSSQHSRNFECYRGILVRTV